MSKYTTEVRYICESVLDNDTIHGADSVDSILALACPKVFNFDFPIFDDNYRLPLEIKILKHYYTREIGAETVGLWKLWLNQKLNEIMPYYNKLYESELLEFNPLYDTDYKSSGSSERNEESNRKTNYNDKVKSDGASHETYADNAHTTENINRWDKYSDTPQGDIRDMLDEHTYLTNARHITQDTDTNTNSNRQNTNATESNVNKIGENDEKGKVKDINDYINHVTGKRGTQSYSKMLEEFRKTFLNIDMMIIEELSELFMKLW